MGKVDLDTRKGSLLATLALLFLFWPGAIGSLALLIQCVQWLETGVWQGVTGMDVLRGDLGVSVERLYNPIGMIGAARILVFLLELPFTVFMFILQVAWLVFLVLGALTGEQATASK